MKLRVVVVEDDADSRLALSELLAAKDFEPLPFASGEGAWAALAGAQVRPDIVVSDVRMPGLDGLGLLGRIKARFPALPVVLVSGFADEAVWREGLRAGALDVFPKPVPGASLLRALRDAVGAVPA